MLRHAQVSTFVERLWVAPALQEFFSDFRGRFVSTVVCPACLCFGIASTGPDEFRERGSNRLIDLRGPETFPECPCSWLSYFRIITSTSCISWAVCAVRTLAAGILVSLSALPRWNALPCLPSQLLPAETVCRQ